ncbi:hypothetical protein METBIDRAFT_34880 [Metschnikowia bicuspidata var. bicuspidata NRRL YB-4993]|uniref:DNA repair protein RAD50 n=1 Tax=Metschnikowia bicuspidata var. bicuspidata NRRL YB-4993 TaxID=869754 RepID=A0A1A0HG94_9ASCO|nr:hypothetical protein METBIDRAFT_34880 [Metschnikowia bicuspidata var. bicuspidata NRRL YB-4993]OBA23026.1 hypothetical protein METBIDRAFT_34880 [Metschnikowia bicuspidata var. bicuspidata NRRL YB-4993]
MSSLYKLSICGVRSFSPRDHETIQFGSPLTLICGQNGCGKTTIIECLKYATTGDLPPNSKGGAFVNDPAVADRLAVNAEIKLGFTSVDGKLMTVTRNMQLTRKRGGTRANAANAANTANTFKSLEGQLAVLLRGAKTAVSSKNAELDARVPRYLGASRAVLESVIFCHQDDSLWPLSEAGVLKKRFDEIFEALRFTRVLDALKTVRKDMATDVRVLEQAVAHAHSDQARAHKLRAKAAALGAQADAYLLQIAAVAGRIERLERQADDLFRSHQAFHLIVSEHQRLRLLVDLTQAAVRRLEASVALLRDPDAALHAMAADFAATTAAQTRLLAAARAAVAAADARLADLQARLHALVRDEGSLAAKTAQHAADGARLEQLKDQAGARGLAHADAQRRLEETRARAATSLQHVLQAAGERRAAANNALQAAADGVRTEHERLAHCREETAATAAKMRAARSRLAAVAGHEEQLEAERARLDGLRQKMAQRRAAADTQAADSLAAEDAQAVRRLELRLDELMRQTQAAGRLADVLGKKDLVREARDAKRAVLGLFVAAHTAGFARLFGAAIDPASAAGLVDAERRARAEAHETRQAEARAQHAVVAAATAEAHAGETRLAGLRAALADHAARVLAVLAAGEEPQYEALVRELEADHATAVHNLNTYEVTRSYKLKAVEMARASRSCALCHRGMDAAELAAFVADVEASVRTFTPDKLAADVAATRKDLEELRAINADVLELRRVRAELSGLETQQTAAAGRLREASDALSAAARLADDSLAALAELDALSRPAADIARLADELRGLDNQLAELDREIAELGVPPVPMAELQTQQQQAAAELKGLRQRVADAEAEGNARLKELARLEYQLKDKELVISQLQLGLSEATGLKHQIAEMEAHDAALRDKGAALQTRLAELLARRDAAQAALEQADSEAADAEAEHRTRLDAAARALELFTRLHDLVLHYEQVDAPLVAQNERDMADARLQMDAAGALKSEKQSEAAQLQGFIADAAGTERNIRDNLELRDLTRQLEEQQAALAAVDIEAAEREKEQYLAKAKQLRDEIAGLNEQHYSKVGEVKQIRDQILALHNELRADYLDADKVYHDEWIKLQTNLLVSTDLQTYLQALDNAIMKYHSMKMDEINRILRELWTQTYRGTDIDSIEIKCDVTNQTRGRSYNYRVVMYKRSSELDMRGRCSAGQKVLTSILIRLALAECFGSNCGMIALDEPTTNLDEENAESLANALSNIIEFRKSQKNFQLIVITHDEKFLNHINRGRFVDNFYRIERDEKQHSIIRSLPIHVMQGE